MEQALAKDPRFRITSLLVVAGLAFLVLGYVLVGVKSERFEAFVAILVALVALVYGSVWAWSKRRRGLALAGVLLVWWASLELLAAPYLARPLQLHHYTLLKDVDHRPRDTDGEFNSDSLRSTPEPQQFSSRDLNLLFLGDSFTYGMGVAGPSAFPIRVGQALQQLHPGVKVNVANFAWISSSPLLSLRRLTEIGPRYKPKIVILALDMTDFSDDIRYQHMLDRKGIYAYYDRFPIALQCLMRFAPTWHERLVSWSVGGIPARGFFVTDAPLEETRTWIERMQSNVEKIRAWSLEHRAHFLLVVLPRAYQYTDREHPENWERGEYENLGPYCQEPFRYFEELRSSVDYPICSLLPVFQATNAFPLYFVDDPHWNDLGHAVAAQGVLDCLEPLVGAVLAGMPK